MLLGPVVGNWGRGRRVGGSGAMGGMRSRNVVVSRAFLPGKFRLPSLERLVAVVTGREHPAVFLRNDATAKRVVGTCEFGWIVQKQWVVMVRFPSLWEYGAGRVEEPGVVRFDGPPVSADVAHVDEGKALGDQPLSPEIFRLIPHVGGGIAARGALVVTTVIASRLDGFSTAHPRG